MVKSDTLDVGAVEPRTDHVEVLVSQSASKLVDNIDDYTNEKQSEGHKKSHHSSVCLTESTLTVGVNTLSTLHRQENLNKDII
jgi:hypothetical protein